jgi:hypothetical protein
LNAFSIYGVDLAKESGRIIVEFHSYDAAVQGHPHISLSRSDDLYWFEHYRDQFERLFAAGTKWEPPVLGTP